ncbi:peptidase A8, signal peptidase II [Simiduia agarivorans SA1 = DSM 21679]|uniref:Tol-Pal system protein TolQ n=1 Tax=Simiduia agarivorans (strain DSM 21679 / JCM 13881 / BCRC 17597 / SA1) TaxID=1117647 RepID=R9S5W9_SIMAS|nr:peptidase A8, signal peptidase II [Simiduia agarivorans SA1 = DSM 21679]
MANAEPLSIWSLIAEASLLVQLVMALLFLASVVSWIMIVQRGLYQRQAAASLRAFERTFWSGIDLNQLYRQGSGKGGHTDGVENIFRAGFKEFSRLRQQQNVDPDAVMEGVQRAMRVALAREEKNWKPTCRSWPVWLPSAPISVCLAPSGASVNSFRGLANVHQATLATVAPGISEALVATAMGLFAAIPAVLAYNRYSAKAESLLGAYETFSDEFSAILHRQVHSK